jgi:transposase
VAHWKWLLRKEAAGSLFKIERSLVTAPCKKREHLRAKHSRPIVERFFSWCDVLWPELYEDTQIYDGVRYARNEREGLSRFLGDGQLPLHNNASELNLSARRSGGRTGSSSAANMAAT